MRQWTAQVFLGHGNESLAWEGGHIHHATAQNHRIGIEQINAGGNGSWPRFQADSGRKGRFPHGRKDRSMGNFGAVVRTSVLAPFQSNWFPGTQNCHTRSVGSYLPGDMAQFACHTVCTRPRRTVHPHCEPHPRTEIGCQNQLLRKAVFYYVPGEL